MISRLIDSVILIDHLNGIDRATNFILELDPLQTAISVITRAEILAGLSKEEIAFATPLLDQYQLFKWQRGRILIINYRQWCVDQINCSD